MADRMSLQLGVARLRQVRIQKGTITVDVYTLCKQELEMD